SSHLFADDPRDKPARFGGEDGSLLASGEVDGGDGLAQGVGNLTQVEGLFPLWREQKDLRQKGRIGRHTFAPGELRADIYRGLGGALQREVVCERRVHPKERGERVGLEKIRRRQGTPGGKTVMSAGKDTEDAMPVTWRNWRGSEDMDTTRTAYSSSSLAISRADAFWYSVTRPSKKFCSFLMSIISASHGSGFLMPPFNGLSPQPSSRRSAM